MKWLPFLLTIAILHIWLQERRTTILMYAHHRSKGCYAPHCAVCRGYQYPDGRLRESDWSKLPVKRRSLRDRLLGVPK